MSREFGEQRNRKWKFAEFTRGRNNTYPVNVTIPVDNHGALSEVQLMGMIETDADNTAFMRLRFPLTTMPTDEFSYMYTGIFNTACSDNQRALGMNEANITHYSVIGKLGLSYDQFTLHGFNMDEQLIRHNERENVNGVGYTMSLVIEGEVKSGCFELVFKPKYLPQERSDLFANKLQEGLGWTISPIPLDWS